MRRVCIGEGSLFEGGHAGTLSLSDPIRHWFHATCGKKLSPRDDCRADRTIPPVSLPLTKAITDQRNERVHRLIFVGALRLERNAAALAGGEHHDPHHALGVHLAAVAGQRYVALVFRGELRQLGRRPGVQPELVDDLNLLLPHKWDRPRRATLRRSPR